MIYKVYHLLLKKSKNIIDNIVPIKCHKRTRHKSIPLVFIHFNILLTYTNYKHTSLENNDYL